MPNTPMYILYHGRNTGKDKDGKKIWTCIGAVWPNKSGKGFNLTWDYLPLGDGLTVMLPCGRPPRPSGRGFHAPGWLRCGPAGATSFPPRPEGRGFSEDLDDKEGGDASPPVI